MKATLLAVLAVMVLLSGCGYLQGLTAKSTQQECNDAISKAGAEFCKTAAENRDKIKAATDALK